MANLSKALLIVVLFAFCTSRLTAKDGRVDKNVLLIEYSGDADVVQFKMFEGLEQVLVKDSINNTFRAIIEIPNLDDAIFTYDLVVQQGEFLGRLLEMEVQKNLIKINGNSPVEKHDKFLWVGENRRGDYEMSETLQGEICTLTLNLGSSHTEREITIYEPREIDGDIPIVYMTDGEGVDYYARHIDKLIEAEIIEPIKLVGVHSSLSYRYDEYVRGSEDNKFFNQHESFFYDQVMKNVEADIENWQGERYLYGFSNGAAFCVHAGLNHSSVFKEIIAFSTADYIDPIAQEMNLISFEKKVYPKFYMGSGKYETGNYRDNLEFVDKLNNHRIDVEFKEFISGHDYNVWLIEFLEYLEQEFAK